MEAQSPPTYRIELTGSNHPGQAPLSQEQLEARSRWNDFNKDEKTTFDTVSTRLLLSQSYRTSRIHSETADILGREQFGPLAPTLADAEGTKSGYSTFGTKWRNRPPPDTLEEADTLIRSKLEDRYAVARQLLESEDHIVQRVQGIMHVASDPGQAAVDVLEGCVSTIGSTVKNVASSLM